MLSALIRYHGTPITPDAAAAQILRGRHGMVSFAHPQQLGMVAEVCQSFVLDNGAYSHWRKGRGTIDVVAYTEWVMDWHRHPGFDWCLIPDVIDGVEADNDDMHHQFQCEIAKRSDWLQPVSVPVWHLHESLDRLRRLLNGNRRVAFGSSGEYSEPWGERWKSRMNEAFRIICDDQGRPKTKVHGLRMMNPTIFSRYPFSSVDSCNVARNIGLDKSWDSCKYGRAIPKSTRGVVMAEHCEAHASATIWVANEKKQYEFLFG